MLIGGGSAAAVPPPPPTDLGDLGFPYAAAVAVNDSGQVVGSSALANGDGHAFLWTQAGGMIDLGTLGALGSGAAAVNDSGQVVGSSTLANGRTHAFSWTQAGGMVDLQTLGGTSTRAKAVNGSGQVVGSSDLANFDEHAFLWTQAGGMIDLRTLGGTNSSALAVNDSGQVVGESSLASGVHAFLWTQAGGMIDLQTLGGTYSSAVAVNDSGQVVGESNLASGVRHAFSWTQAGGMIDLQTLGGTTSAAVAVNGSGQVVGSSTLANGRTHAFSWTQAGGMIDLQTLGGTTSLAKAVNGSGQVVGSSTLANGDTHAFLWTQAGGMIDLGTFAGDTNSSAVAVSDSGSVVGSSQRPNGFPRAVLWQLLPASVSFDWTVPARFGDDADGNGMLDYFAPDGSLDIHPVGFRVDFTTATGASCDQTLSRTWSIDGVEVTASDPGVVFYDPHDCRFSYRFAKEGTYEVELELEDANGNLLGFKTHEVVVQDFLIVSLGDSVGSGEGNPDLPQSGGPERWQNQQCHRSAFAGPAQAALQVEQADDKTSVTFVHLACSGATVGDGLLGRYKGIEGGKKLPPQVQAMRTLVGTREIDAVLVSIGANDVQFSDLIFRCFVRPRCDQGGPGSAARLFEKKIVKLPGRYDKLDLALQPPQVPSERVYVSEYFDPTRDGSGAVCDDILADNPFGGGSFEITVDEARWASETMLVRLNAEVLGATARHGWRYAGGIRSQFLTHGYCAPLSWVDTYTESILAQGDEYGTLHPNRPGHLAYAGQLAAGLRADLYDGGDLTKPRPPK